jgi:copper chaperone
LEDTTQTYSTTINCSSCVSKVQSTLDELLGEGNWKVDTNSPEKILEFKSDALSEDELILRLAQLGYIAKRKN